MSRCKVTRRGPAYSLKSATQRRRSVSTIAFFLSPPPRGTFSSRRVRIYRFACRLSSPMCARQLFSDPGPHVELECRRAFGALGFRHEGEALDSKLQISLGALYCLFGTRTTLGSMIWSLLQVRATTTSKERRKGSKKSFAADSYSIFVIYLTAARADSYPIVLSRTTRVDRVRVTLR